MQKNCHSTHTCRVCRAPHHTHLHFDSKPAKHATPAPYTTQGKPLNGSQDTLVVPEIINNTSAAMNSATLSSHTVLTSTSLNQITTLLSTVLVELINAWGNPIKVRALLDSASQVSFVIEKCARRLGIPRSKFCIPIQGIGQGSSTSSGTVNYMPTNNIDTSKWKYIANMTLADPTFGTPGKIDVLLGADIFPEILQNGKITGKDNQPTAINTVFG
ncbi:hypothetical protein ILUMI_14130 [Ignelater luminosus]|nr:hypothetical protein ILUMI_14130 [Ignelater luminosus]